MTIQLTFGEDGNADRFQRNGWSAPEDGFTWSVGSESDLHLPIPPGAGTGDLLLEMRVAPFTAPGLPGQTLIVSANNTTLGRAFLLSDTALLVPIPRATFADAKAIYVAFRQPDATAGEDERELAFAFRSLRLAPRPEPPAELAGGAPDPREIVTAKMARARALHLTFGAGGDAEPYLVSGWSAPEDGFTWSIGPRSELRLPRPRRAGDLLLELQLEPFITPDLPSQTLIVSVNDTVLHAGAVLTTTMLCVPVPYAAFADARQIDVVFEQPDATSPRDAGVGADPRQLAFGFRNVWLGPRPSQVTEPARVYADRGVVTAEIAQSPALHLTFGEEGNAEPFQHGGWSVPEDGMTWSVGTHSRLALPMPFGSRDLALESHDLALELLVDPCTGDGLPGQALIVSVNGTVVGREVVFIPTVLSLPVPAAAIAGARALEISFHHPDATSPAALGFDENDVRELAFAFHRLTVWTVEKPRPARPRTQPPLRGVNLANLAEVTRRRCGLAPRDLVVCFESLGQNCEFGLVQRHFGAEPSGLLRFTSITQPGLLDGLRQRFAGIAEPENLEVYELLDDADPEGEWMVRDRLYGTQTHTFLTREQAAPNIVLWQAQRLFAERYRNMLDTLHKCDKIFVFQHRDVRSLAAIQPIASAMARWGPNMLLWVTEGSGYPSGSVTIVQPGLLLGAIDKLAPETAVASADMVAWISLLANAFVMSRDPAAR